MKGPVVKVAVAVILAGGVFAAFIAWYPYVFSLVWPSLALARVGVPHSWVASAILLVGGVTWLGFWSRRRAWIRVIAASLIIPAGYSVLAYVFVTRASIPLPKTTPYDSTATERAVYLHAYDSGYRDGEVGSMRTYCFSPEAETKGFYDGGYQGSVVWYRMLGRTMPDRAKRLLESSAAIDGVRLESK